MVVLMGIVMREAGKTAADAIGEVREAVDFLRYYAVQARKTLAETQSPLGPVVCISPWNFPLAIFTGQVAAALAAGNTVLAKPAEETPLIAMAAVQILHEAGVPAGAVQLLPGAGEVGAIIGDQHPADAARIETLDQIQPVGDRAGAFDVEQDAQPALGPRIVEVGLHPDGSLRDRHLLNLPALAPNLYALRMDAELDFASASTLERAITTAIAERPGLTDVCLFAHPINRVDLTGAEVFGSIRRALEGQGIRLHVSGLKLPAMQVLERAGLLQPGPLLFTYRTDSEALAALRRQAAD